ncbi:MAG: DUF1800 family protein [Burkholderiales bacterium]|nr:MAG: DUF1800 family protein [Burkholderiales bacterium]
MGGDDPWQQPDDEVFAKSTLSAGAAARATPKSTGGALRNTPTSQLDAVRLAHQATFGPTERLVLQIRQQGPARWISGQMRMAPSRYVRGGSDAIHKHTNASRGFCTGRGDQCWRDWYSSTPLLWDFYRNATSRPDQLRQRVAFALQQMLVISNLEVEGTYGLRNYHNMLLSQAFGNYRDILRLVTLSPVMGDYLNNANNDPVAPNENFARELLQLFSVGTCELNQDGSLSGGVCQATYDNDTVRAYAYALTGWTYPRGGRSPWGCWPSGTNCRYYKGNMVPVADRHDSNAYDLLSGVSLAQGHTAPQALEAVLDSLMNHPNIGPFVGRHLIQQLVTSNPSPAYVARVAQAFRTGRFEGFGLGRPGDMKATVAAILLDPEARAEQPSDQAGRLREPVQLFTGVLRALNGRTDGDALGWWWGEELRQHVFRPPSVFNFYPPDYPVAGTSLVGPAFGIHNANAALQRLNFINYLVFWGGSQRSRDVPRALGTQVNLTGFIRDAEDAGRLVDRLSLLLLGEVLPADQRTVVINAVETYPVRTSPRAERTESLTNRVRQAAYLVLATPQYHLTR